MSAPYLVQDQLDQLRRRVDGAVTAPGDPEYDEARTVWNAMIDRRPSAVVRAADVDDVVSTIAVARDHGLDLAIRAGGHNVAGNGTVDDGIVLDLGAMNGVTVDPDTATVRVEGGATLADVDAATEPYGLAVPLGVVSATGVGGLTLGGGVGWLTRPHGLTADNLLSVEIVTADGERLTAGPAEHADLFWALRGGGGNFGVVTAFNFRADPHGPEVFSGNLVYGQDRWPEAWAALERWTRDLPDELTMITTTLTPPPAMEMGSDPLLVVGFVWASPDRAAGEAVVGRLREAAPPDVEQVGDNRWVEWQSVLDGLVPKGVRAYWRNASFDRLDAEVIDVLTRRGREQTWVGTAFDVHHLGGAFGRVPEHATAFPNRSARFWINMYGFWDDAAVDDERVAFVRGLSGDMDRFATGGQYLNFQGHEASGHRAIDPRTVFGPVKYERLVQVKRRYDPGNLFHVNHNIPPG
ncbi:FAD-binding oxidoreductase [Blastococcus sp. VKM Ac-2987]|uniref:FAD-binding oxidoreductase n=1 Tax=Blastococcus sp. VKM Ac-2987 TaxID=3004141 RepID=UPI0022ABC07C|nr:FAD-binding oxidoreductase [Blastococcus sp. VKM Ac-2987]MCZ2860800.1 FAD-binding oxidoreductase [Blastococcus sp. VKM Ac-2987]